MHYYQIFPPTPHYYFHPPNIHLHQQLTAISHLRQQVQHNYLSRSHHQLAALEKTKQYQQQLFHQQLRRADIRERTIAQQFQRQLLEEETIRQELKYREQFRKLQRQRFILENNQPFQSERKRQSSLIKQELSNKLKSQNKILSNNYKQTAKISNETEQGFGFKPKEYQTHRQINEKSRQRADGQLMGNNIQSKVRNISYCQEDDGEEILPHNNSSQRRSSILKSSHKKTPKPSNSKRVKFVKNDSPLFQKNHESYCLNNSALKAAYQSPKINFKSDASKKISNRLKLSYIVYRDSQFRNIKHEMEHLFNTYQTECRLRRDVKSKINTRDEIISKYNIVQPDGK